MDVITASKKFRDALAKQDEEAIKRLLQTYQGIYSRLSPRIELFISKVELALAKGEPVTMAQIKRMDAYKQLLVEINQEIGKYSTVVEYETSILVKDAMAQGIKDSRNIVRLYTDSEIVRGSFRTLNPDVVENLTGYLDEAGPLFQRIKGMADMSAKLVSESILDGVTLGQNPNTIAARITKELGIALTDSVRTVRTVQIYAYREANRASYIANNDVVKGWIWLSARDDSVCMGCLAEDNEEIRPLSETLDDHYQGRCSMIPVVYDASVPVSGSGQAWFDKQPEATQREMMGDAKWEAWKGGKFEFQDLSTARSDEVYGQMKTETSLKDLLGGE